MTASLETVIEIIALLVVIFHKRILAALGFDPKRLRDLIGYVTDFLAFAAGMSLTNLALLMLYIIRYEKRFGPVRLNRA